MRVEHLPAAPVFLSNGDGLLLELPGPKGVKGFHVNARGQVQPTTKRGHYIKEGTPEVRMRQRARARA